MSPKNALAKKGVILTLGLIILLALAYIFFHSSESTRDEIVARVGNEVITRHDVDIRVRQSLVRGQGGGLVTAEALLFDRSLDDLITESLLFQDALREGFSIDKEEIERRYGLVRSNYDSEAEFLERMMENLMTPDEFRENLGRQILLFSYLEELKRREIQSEITQSINANQPADGPFLEVEAERTRVTKEDIASISSRRAEELKKEFEIEVYLK